LETEAEKALELAMELTDDAHAILCTGSFYLGGEIAKAYRKLLVEMEVAACP
jgi:folylpolyglutamate synthase/dihydropteroate synthase